MLSLTISHKNGQPLADQIVAGIKRRIEKTVICGRVTTNCPQSVTFAVTHSVSRFTVIEAYDRLVAMGYYLQSMTRCQHSRMRSRRPTQETTARCVRRQ